MPVLNTFPLFNTRHINLKNKTPDNVIYILSHSSFSSSSVSLHRLNMSLVANVCFLFPSFSFPLIFSYISSILFNQLFFNFGIAMPLPNAICSIGLICKISFNPLSNVNSICIAYLTLSTNFVIYSLSINLI